MLVGFTGYAGSGKDEAARALTDLGGWVRVSFAEPIRKALLALDPVVHYDCVDERLVHLAEVVEELGWDRAKVVYPIIREYLQVLGTEVGREIIDPDIWVDMAARSIQWHLSTQNVVVTDVRFPNEVKLIRSLGGRIYRISRLGVGPTNAHVSEKHLADVDGLIANDGTVEQLHDSVCGTVSGALRDAKIARLLSRGEPAGVA